jgi:hypothetical protein
MLSAPDETRDETPSMVWLYMAHVIDFPPIWDLLDHQPAAETLQFTDLRDPPFPSPPEPMRPSKTALTTAASIKKRARLAEWDTSELRGQLGLV